MSDEDDGINFVTLRGLPGSAETRVATESTWHDSRGNRWVLSGLYSGKHRVGVALLNY